MMNIRDAINRVKGFRYMTEQLDICSSLAQRALYDMCWMAEPAEIREELSRVATVKRLEEQPEHAPQVERVCCRLMQLHDIRGSVNRTGENVVLDDLEFFELKYFALLAGDIREEVKEWQVVSIPDLQGVISLLDPENNRVPHFYIYDAYSAELAALRKELKQKQQQGATASETEDIYYRSLGVEDKVREELSRKLKAYHRDLQQALEQVAKLDVIIAKAKQAEKMQLSCPIVLEQQEIRFRGLFHPQLRANLRMQGREFQPVDLEILPVATLVTGANMVGKTVLLKSIALAQCLMQFGFWVPATGAEMGVVEEVFMSVGDDQDELNGLSSYAAEILRVNEIVGEVRKGRKILVLIDELARTTNPEEGRAIVNSVVGFLTANKVMALVTTHYSGIMADCRKLRVRGFVENKKNGEVNLKNINEFIDYSLREDAGEEIPHEALRIAALLGVDQELLRAAEAFLPARQSEESQTVQ